MILTEYLLEVFPRLPPADTLTVSDLDDRNGKKLRKYFDGKSWWQIDPEVLSENFDMLPLFSSVGFCYYLPAFLFYSIANFEPYNPILEFSIYALSPTNSLQYDEWHRERLCRFSNEQVSFFKEFLQAIVTDESMREHHKDAESAINALDMISPDCFSI